MLKCIISCLLFTETLETERPNPPVYLFLLELQEVFCRGSRSPGDVSYIGGSFNNNQSFNNNLFQNNYDTRLCGLCPYAGSRIEERRSSHKQCPADSSGRLLCWNDRDCQKCERPPVCFISFLCSRSVDKLGSGRLVWCSSRLFYIVEHAARC